MRQLFWGAALLAASELILISFAGPPSRADQTSAGSLVHGRNFSVPATQQIKFVPLRKIDPTLYLDKRLPRQLDLRAEQSSVKRQGQRGACTYFAITGLIEGIIKKELHKE